MLQEPAKDTWSVAKVSARRFDVSSLAIDPTRVDTLYAATSSVPIAAPDGTVLKTSDGGRTWTDSGQGLPTTRLIAVAVDGADPSVVYVGSLGSGLFMTSSAGGSWNMVPSLKGQNVYALATTRDGDVFAGTSNGVFKSQDRGATWVAVNNGFFRRSTRFSNQP